MIKYDSVADEYMKVWKNACPKDVECFECLYHKYCGECEYDIADLAQLIDEMEVIK